MADRDPAHPLRRLAEKHEDFMYIERLREPIAYYRSQDYIDDQRSYIRQAMTDSEMVALFYGFFSTDWNPWAQRWMRDSIRGERHFRVRMMEAFAVKYHLLDEYVRSMQQDWPGTFSDAEYEHRPKIQSYADKLAKELIPPLPKILEQPPPDALSE